MSDVLRVGGVTVAMPVAERWVEAYTDPARRTETKPYAYPAYDTYEQASDPYTLSDADLLAPGLLNVNISLRAYYVLQDMRPHVEEAFKLIQPDANWANIDTDTAITAVEKAYSPLDVPQLSGRGVRRTTLSKVLHRKRPNFFALHDSRVSNCYYDIAGGIETDRKRSRAQSMGVFTQRVAQDVASQTNQLDQLAEAVDGPVPLTHLRLLDIVAWRANGKDHLD
ncbi:MAG: DUF6308 family protein [Cumulibacter sp.]